MNEMPKGFKMEKIMAIPEAIQEKRERQYKWEWLYKRLSQMEPGTYYRFECPNEKEVGSMLQAIKRYAVRNQKSLPPVLARNFRCWPNVDKKMNVYEVFIECVASGKKVKMGPGA
jgi:hypothetical protein